MQPRLYNLLYLCVTCLLLQSSLAAGAAGAQVSAKNGNSRDARDGQLFPYLRSLRDWAVELAFGRSESRKDAIPKLPGALQNDRYRDDVVIRFNVTSPDEETALSEATDRMFLDVWAFTQKYVDIRLRREDIRSLLTLLPTSLQPSVLIPDVAAAVWGTYPSQNPVTPEAKTRFEADRIDPATVSRYEGVDNIFFRNYQPLSVISSWLRLLEAMFPSYVEMISIGKSYEDRDIPALRVGRQLKDVEEAEDYGPRKTILVTGGLHAREWISTSSVNYLAWSFVTAYGRERLITKLLQHFDIVFIPVLNPDGYEYTWQVDRLWRKSRQQTNMRFCRGLDLDHAFGYEWDAAGPRIDPCSESYGGDQPFQAVEASELAGWARNETQSNNVTFVGFLDLHSYSQQVLFPYSHTCAVDPPNRENLEELAVGLAKAIRLSSGESYSVTSACEGATAHIYGANGHLPRIESGGGSAIDWFYRMLSSVYPTMRKSFWYMLTILLQSDELNARFSYSTLR